MAKNLPKSIIFAVVILFAATLAVADVVIVEFHAAAGYNRVELTWKVSQETNVSGYQIQRSTDILTNLGRGGGRVGMEGQLGEGRSEGAKSAVFRTEIVAPLADAMGFIDRDKGNLELLEIGDKIRFHGPFRCDIEEFDITELKGFVGLLTLPLCETAVDEGRVHPHSVESVYLIFHEGDQGRDDQRHAFPCQRGCLVAQRLAAARGEDDEGIPFLQDARHGLVLKGTEGFVAPMAFYEGGNIGL